jgi:phosphoadenosine phosphosulfate reductase
MVLRWCKSCNVPILNLKNCSVCDNKTQQVIYTPPGDIRPAFEFDLLMIKEVIDKQFGPGCGSIFIPDNGVVILNRAPDLDRLDEIIFDGVVQGALKFDLFNQDFKFLPRISGAKVFMDNICKGFVVVDPGAEKPILASSNALAPGIVEASKDINFGDEVLVLNKQGKLLGVGSAHMNSLEMLESNHGLAVKVRWRNKLEAKLENNTPSDKINDQSNNNRAQSDIWERTIKANKHELVKVVNDAKEFVISVTEKYNLPFAVSFSGGKDSLATLLLTLDSGIDPKLFFINTGLEFPETVSHVHSIAKKFKLDLITGEPTNTFWSGLEYFGPPGKDYRWCCKTCKLGPTTRLIKKTFPKGVLMFIGQRRSESQQRSLKNMVWHNPWVPGQVGASPIQHWSALHIWLYLFSKGIEFNKLYRSGFERIGCWLCPASDLADFKILSEHHPDYPKWLEYLVKYSDLHSYTPFWLKGGLWRWKKLPKGVKKLMEEHNIELKDPNLIRKKMKETQQSEKSIENDKILIFRTAEGFSDCEFGLSKEGAFNKELDMVRVVNLGNILGEVTYEPSDGFCNIDEHIDIYPEGGVVVKGKTPKDISKRVKKIHNVILRAMECISCGICVGRCDNQALHIDESDELQRIKLDKELCTHCGSCLGPCPVINFNVSESFEM